MHRPRAPEPRRLLLPAGVFLLIGCVLIPVEESRFGSSAVLRFTADHAPYASRDILFSHELHASSACDECHFGTTAKAPEIGAEPEEAEHAKAEPARSSREAGPVALPGMALCFTCHDGKANSNDCITCHIVNRRDRKPGFHDGLFPRHHDRMAEEESFKCELCHVERECKTCHAERKPLSHTPRFERSTHGRMATHDRRSCATCHETAFCENCHSQPPPDHTAIFTRGGGHRQAALVRGRSCTVCHRFEDACAECHG